MERSNSLADGIAERIHEVALTASVVRVSSCLHPYKFRSPPATQIVWIEICWTMRIMDMLWCDGPTRRDCRELSLTEEICRLAAHEIELVEAGLLGHLDATGNLSAMGENLSTQMLPNKCTARFIRTQVLHECQLGFGDSTQRAYLIDSTGGREAPVHFIS